MINNWMNFNNNGLMKSFIFKEFAQYSLDFIQRTNLFMDVMRKRGNEAVGMHQNNSSHVLNFEFEIIMDGENFDRPINYWLARIIAPDHMEIDYSKRPYVVQDPRAGQGPGIGGFKKDSEIGNALKNGHPVYFIGFNSMPIDGQTYEDIIKGQVKFYEKINELHSEGPKLCAMGNCAAGYLTMFSAMQRPDLFGPILIAGAPLSYWNGKRGKYPMRYNGGLVGGSWVNSFLGDIGGGKFDGTYLVLNFNLLDLNNFLWKKQYDLFANIDQGSERYLQFEKWWGDFIQFNTNEIKWIVDNLFIKNRLTTGNLTTSDGILLDPRNISSPIITFVSDGDNISPPGQSAGWIADLYHDREEIVARGKTIIYCLNPKIGHLGIFTATKVGKREHAMFIKNMDTIDLLPPGLYELILETPEGEEDDGPLESRYVPRTIEDIKKLGFNNEHDDRAFATVASASEAISMVYSKFVHPLFKLFANPSISEMVKNTKPLRLSYAMFSDQVNPFMKIFEQLAIQSEKHRTKLDPNNKFLTLQNGYAHCIGSYLKNIQKIRDAFQEQVFFSIWSNPMVQEFWGTHNQTPRYTPSITQFDREQLNTTYQEEIKKNLQVRNDVEAFLRFIIMVIDKNNSLRDRTAQILINHVRQMKPQLQDDDLYHTIKSQTMVVLNDKKLALAELKKYILKKANFNELADEVRSVANQIGSLPPEVHQYIQQIKEDLLSA